MQTIEAQVDSGFDKKGDDRQESMDAPSGSQRLRKKMQKLKASRPHPTSRCRSPIPIRRETAEHSFSTIEGATHFLCKGLKAVRTEMSLLVLAYNLREIMAKLGVGGLCRCSLPE